MRILVPTAGPVPARDNADYIMKIAGSLKATVDVLHIIKQGDDDRPGREALEVFSQAAKKSGVSVTTSMEFGEVVPTILAHIQKRKVDLLVMGASEGKVAAKWLASNVLSEVDIPVFIIPQGMTQLVDDF